MRAQVTYYHSGISNWYLGEVAHAHAAFSKSVALRPDYSDAQAWKVRCEAKLAGDAFATASAAAGDAAAADAAPPTQPPPQQQQQQQ